MILLSSSSKIGFLSDLTFQNICTPFVVRNMSINETVKTLKTGGQKKREEEEETTGTRARE